MAATFKHSLAEPIALVGIGCRYPGAGSAADLWRLLMQSRETIHDYAEDRFAEMNAFYADSARKKNGIAVHRGGFLHSIDRFDAQFFELAPREVLFMDPQYRLLMEVAWEALEDGGQVRGSYQGSNTGVFIGLSEGDYEAHLYHTASELDFYMMSNGNRSSASGRLSYTFGLEGPSLTVDTACSSSLVAVHLACQALKSGKIDMALAGGVHVMTGIHTTHLFAQAKMLAADGRCKFGDAAADGFVRSEGCGVVVLKRLSDAAAAGDRVYAVLRGSAVNNDGRTNGLMMTPSIEGQQKMLHQAWDDAGIHPNQLRYIEAHGTGTAVGDPVELGAIGEALAHAGVSHACLLGSIKTNIGHTEAASGVAGLIKAALALHRRALPPSLNFRAPNPNIAWDTLPIEVLTEAKDLSAEMQPLFAGVNSFGLSGTNAHVVLEDYRQESAASQDEAGACLFTLSAHTREALHARIAGLSEFLRDGGSEHSLNDLCYTANTRRTHLDYRIAIAAENKGDLEHKLHAALAQQTGEGIVSGRAHPGHHRVVFVAPGQGSQWAGMARELMQAQPVFRRAFEGCDEAIRKETGWSLIERVLGSDVAEQLLEIDVVQPALFAVSVALANLWRSWGVASNAVVGHSMGEVAAAHISGALSLDDAVSVICRRSRLMKTISGSGSMATVELPPEEVERYTRSIYRNVSVAAINSPGTTVVAGDPEEVDSLLNMLELKEVFCRRIKVDVASHSAQVDAILPELHQQLKHLQPRDAEIPIFSTVNGEYLSGQEMDAGYWVNNLRKPVLFAKAIDMLAQDGHDIFIELSPHPILIPALESTLSASYPEASLVASLRREKPEELSMLAAFGSLYVAGYPVAWSHLQRHPGNCVPLPAYPFQRESFWPDAGMLLGSQKHAHSAERLNPFLGNRFESSLQPGTILWEADFAPSRFPYLKDHKVRESMVLPASAHIELALEAARSLRPQESFDLADLTLNAAITLSETERQQRFQIALSALGNGCFYFELRSRTDDSESEWILHSSGKLEARKPIAVPRPGWSPSSFAAMQDDAAYISAEEHYGAMSACGIHYGAAFQLFTEAWNKADESLCRIRPTAEDAAGYVIHPTLLDACFQSLSRAGLQSKDTYLPVALRRFSVYADIPHTEPLFVRARAISSKDTIDLDLQIMDSEATVLAEVQGLKAQRVSAASRDDAFSLLFDFEWMADDAAVADSQPTSAIDEHWLIFADDSGAAEMLASAFARQGGPCTFVRPGRDFRWIGTRKSDAAITDFEINFLSRDSLMRLFQELPHPPTAVIHMSSIHAATSNANLRFSEQTSAGFEAVELVQAISDAGWADAPRLCFVTSGAFAIAGSSAIPAMRAATLWGAGLVIAREQPELRTCTVDLSPAPGAAEIERLVRIIRSSAAEDRICLRDKTSYVARLTHAIRPVAEAAQELLRREDEYRFETAEAGMLDQLGLRAMQRETPGPGEVAIEVTVAGLNFIDVAKAMGIYPGLDPAAPVHFGVECAGRIAAVGEGVTEFELNDEVVAISADPHANGTLTSYLIVPVAMVARKPQRLTMEEAAVLPVAYMTAFHSLITLARIRAGEWVLVPSAAGGVGLAAIEIAQRAGAQVIATASTPEKQEYLRILGVHVLPSRSLDFARQALEITQGRGVDVVLNSLTGEFPTKSFEILAPFGRFIELGKRDVYDDRRIGLRIFRNNLSYHVVDVGAGITGKREEFSQLFRYCIRQVDEGKWRPLPVQSFPVSRPDEPFRFMTAGKHIGKIAIVMDRAVRVLPRLDRNLFRADATYLITGAFGGVGSAVAEWMAENGAGHLLLVSRRQASAETRALIQRLEERGAVVTHAQADVTGAQEISDLIAAIPETMPLRGVMHTAASIGNALIKDMEQPSYTSVMDAKVRGALNLHSATLDCSLDFFVLFSSAAAIFTQPGMGSYAAANAYLDALSHHRRARGLPAASVNWGGWEETGLAREAGTKRSLAGFEEQGISNFSREEGLQCLREVLERNAVQTVVFRFSPEQFSSFHAQSGIPPLFTCIAEATATENAARVHTPAIREALASAPTASSRTEMLEAYLREQLGIVLRCAPERIDRDRTMGTLGLDSLMTLEFVRRLNAGLGTALPATSVFNYPTVRLLGEQVISKMGPTVEAEVNAAQESAAKLPVNVANELSEEDTLRELMYPDVSYPDTSRRSR